MNTLFESQMDMEQPDMFTPTITERPAIIQWQLSRDRGQYWDSRTYDIKLDNNEYGQLKVNLLVIKSLDTLRFDIFYTPSSGESEHWFLWTTTMTGRSTDEITEDMMKPFHNIRYASKMQIPPDLLADIKSFIEYGAKFVNRIKK